MALPTRPLAILDACGTTRSIAREVDGNATAPKTLLTLGDTAFGSGARPHAMSEFENYSSASGMKMCVLTQTGSYGSSTHTKCSCLCYDPALAASQSWYACFCWILRAYGDGGTGCACFRVTCNAVVKASCLITRSTSPSLNCNGKFAFFIDDNDAVAICNCSRTSTGAYFANSYSYVCVFCSTINSNGNVVVCQPDGQGTYALCSS